jgi:tetraacyldisaccharide 4'-kinase
MSEWLQKQWFCKSVWHLLLLPLAAIYLGLIHLRKLLYKLNVFKSYALPVPVIVVGNISVGGTGKTPAVIYLAQQLKLAGYCPGIISRGYGRSNSLVQAVSCGSSPDQVGDEPLLIAMRTACPVFVGNNRVAAGVALVKEHPEVNVIISDDGLQHYRLKRSLELAVVDADRGFGNGFLIPAGPLRETVARLSLVDAIVVNGNAEALKPVPNKNLFSMRLVGETFFSLDGKQKKSAAYFKKKKLAAVAGIGNPDRFFGHLRMMSLDFQSQAFPDHHLFCLEDFTPFKDKTILMTEKDAVKCQDFAADIWMLPVDAMIEQGLMKVILNKLARI